MKKAFIFIILAVVIGIGGYVYWTYFNVFGNGVKSGYLNYVVNKGNVFKTYEGKLIQEGFGSGKTGVIASNEFIFSIESDSIYKVLEMNSGKYFDLRYKEYRGTLPWRGHSRYVVTEIVNMK